MEGMLIDRQVHLGVRLLHSCELAGIALASHKTDALGRTDRKVPLL